MISIADALRSVSTARLIRVHLAPTNMGYIHKFEASRCIQRRSYTLISSTSHAGDADLESTSCGVKAQAATGSRGLCWTSRDEFDIIEWRCVSSTTRFPVHLIWCATKFAEIVSVMHRSASLASSCWLNYAPGHQALRSCIHRCRVSLYVYVLVPACAMFAQATS